MANIENFRDEITYDADNSNWSFASTMAGCVPTIAVYLVVVLKLLPAVMKDREPLQMKRIIFFYNVFQVIYSLYLSLLYARYMWYHGIIVKRCATDMTAQMEIIHFIRPYFVAKHIDLMDTVFFALRKKTAQVSLLHVYHHCVMLTWTWLHLFYYPNDQLVFVGFLNSAVHILMYAYYAISSLGPSYAKYVWWKKHLTKVQLVQFILVILQLHYQYKLSPCPIPSFFHWFCISNISAFFLLFLKFYFRSYTESKRVAKQLVTGESKVSEDGILKRN